MPRRGEARCLGTIATRAGRQDPEEAAFVEADTGRTVTFGEFERWSNASATALCDRGLDAGDPLAMLSTDRVEIYVVQFGALKAGLVPLYFKAYLKPTTLAKIL
ncbi:MAG: AMP-binding protein [Natronomonas sp.]|uniref:AMP-binding protein n=1 Tax=Natronomonas sp. TaxID=2184060 RepID=UPI00286FE471|nr:AMP-binding protein [Natronomonas sp.]MDR9430646.1 AMP-binding protein [Natronomonas sp.]